MAVLLFITFSFGPVRYPGSFQSQLFHTFFGFLFFFRLFLCLYFYTQVA